MTKNKNHLDLIEDLFKEQLSLGIIEKLDNLNEFMIEHPKCRFLPHMPIIKLSRETTKCRNVFLSNLCENEPSKVNLFRPGFVI